MRFGFVSFVVAVAALQFASAVGRAGDWPMWRYDAGRTAASDEELPENLRMVWSRKFAPRQQAWDDPLNLDLMTYDRVFEPVVMNGRLFVGFNDRNKLAAFDAKTGAELWSFFTDGPVRMPPVGWKDRVYFCSDDGCLYCVGAADGRLDWKFCGAPDATHAIGNQRLTSAWPARGGPVVRDDTVYFAASIWPFMGVFVYALDAETGNVKWVNDSAGSQFIKQPHSAPSFAGVAPQGALVATKELLLVPGGRSVPAAFNREDGKLEYFEINAGGKGTGGSFVVADEHHFFVHTRNKGVREFNLGNGVKTAFMPNEPVLSGDLVYSAQVDGARSVVRAYSPDRRVVWEVEADGSGDLIRAGSCLYAAGVDGVSVIRLPDKAGETPHVERLLPATGRIQRLLAADERLFATTLDGEIMAFGAGRPVSETPVTEAVVPIVTRERDRHIVSQLLQAGDAEGYAFWFGASDGHLVECLAADLPFEQLAIIEDRPESVRQLRRELDAAGLYGKVTVHQAEPRGFRAPKYVANMVFVGPELASAAGDELIAEFYDSVRPYGGVMALLADEPDRPGILKRLANLNLEQAAVEATDWGVLVRRVGALPGSSDWTHQYGDIANTIKSNDQRVKLPLGVLWFGGNSNMDVLPRHGHGPPEQVVGGRLFVEGQNSLSARDVYTGRVLWKREFGDLGTFGVYYDETYQNIPLDVRYNQVHIPGANGRGTNYVVTEDRVYVVEGNTCHVLDPETGEFLQDIVLPQRESGKPESWGFIGVYRDVLIGGYAFEKTGAEEDAEGRKGEQGKRRRSVFGAMSLNFAASSSLIGFDRHTGQKLWKVEANHSFLHNGIVAGDGRLYCLDRDPKPIEDVLRRRGQSASETYRISAIDVQTGAPLWEITEGVFGTWLGYSESRNLLLQAGAAAQDRLSTEAGEGMAVYSGSDGALRWRNDTRKYAGPCILHNDLIITNVNSNNESAGAFRLEDGKQKLIANPLTGELKPWKFTRAYGCNSVIASENLLTFRSGAAGFYDLLSDAGTGNFGGFKSGCTSNLVVANGVLNAPDYTRTCSCAYQNQTSLALVHMPGVELWTINTAADVAASGTQITQLAINFGAPGDHRDAKGRLWLEYPVVAGDSPPLSIELDSNPRFFRHHSSSMAGCEPPWVLASGVEGANEVRIGLTLAGSEADSEIQGSSQVDGDAKEAAVGAETEAQHSYTLRLYFGAPSALGEGAHVFDVYVQGQRVVRDLTIDPAGPRGSSFAIREFENIMIGKELMLRLVPSAGTTILSGVELVRTDR